jgi:hypothetical protein
MTLLFGREGAKISDDGRRVFIVKPIRRHGGRAEVPRDILSRGEKRNGLGVGETGQAGNGRSKLTPAWNWNCRLEHDSGTLESLCLNGLSFVVSRRMTIAANANLLDEVTATLELRFRYFGLRLWLGTRKSGSAKDGENHSEQNTEQLPCR